MPLIVRSWSPAIWWQDRQAAVTSSGNTSSQAFHAALGFELGPVVADYDGPGEDRVPLSLHLR